MKIVYSEHWIKKHQKKRKDITDDMIEYAITSSGQLKDKHWQDALNAISRIPPSGRILKVIYKKTQEKIFIITAYWLD
ncbi:hypothetical protein A3K73_04870 [Candidatus Pacearchaeota archaeon RBG_13_36_9]|nr:MAG: hypothetical protein A3K73_04870 [Candidatus Pacearchaeota archaeon RBG_13_36_9]